MESSKRIIMSLIAAAATLSAIGVTWFGIEYVPHIRKMIAQQTAIDQALLPLMSDVTNMDTGLRGFLTIKK
jgi:CHASE3 domain sensor protein